MMLGVYQRLPFGSGIFREDYHFHCELGTLNAADLEYLTPTFCL